MGVDDDHRVLEPDDWDDDAWDGYEEVTGRAHRRPDSGGTAGGDGGWADAALDGQVRQRLATLVPLSHEAYEGWDDVRPRMVRARRRRHVAQALTSSVLVAAVALVALQGADRFVTDDGAMVSAAVGGTDLSTPATPAPMLATGEASSTSAADGDDSEGDGPSQDVDGTVADDGDPTGSAPAPDEGPATDAVAVHDTGPVPGPAETVVTTVAIGGATTPPATTPTSTGSPATSGPTFRSTTSTTGRSATTARPTTTTRPVTTTTAATTAVQVRDLASLDVTIRGGEIRLVAVHPATGVHAEVHNSGPEKIEITFTRGGESHQMVATARNGNVVTSVVDASDD